MQSAIEYRLIAVLGPVYYLDIWENGRYHGICISHNHPYEFEGGRWRIRPITEETVEED